MRFRVLLFSFKGEEFDVLLYVGIAPGSSNETFSVEDGVGGVGCQLIFGSVSDQTFSLFSEGYIRRCDSVSLIVGNDFYTSVFENANTEKKRMKTSNLPYI